MSKIYDSVYGGVIKTMNSPEVDILTGAALFSLLNYVHQLEQRIEGLEQRPEPYDYFRPIG